MGVINFFTIFICLCLNIVIVRSYLPSSIKHFVGHNNDLLRQRLNSVMEPVVPDLKNVKNRINEIVEKEQIQSVKLRHIQVETEELALECRKMIIDKTASFNSLAESLSTCIATKDLGGETGWIQVDDQSNSDFNSEGIVINPLGMFPLELLNAALNMNKGDIVVISSKTSKLSMMNSNSTNFSINSNPMILSSDGNDVEIESLEAEQESNLIYSDAMKHANDAHNIRTTWHVVQLLDVITKLNPALMKRKMENFKLKQKYNPSTAVNDIRSPSDADKILTYHIETMGCQMNVADSERMEGQLKELGYTAFKSPLGVNPTHAAMMGDRLQIGSDSIVGAEAAPDVVIINTCSIRDRAEQKVYSYIGPHALRKRQGEDVSIIVSGCVAQQEGEALIKRFPEVDVVMGPQYANRLGDLLGAVFDGNQVVATDPSYQSEDNIPALRSRSDLSAYVNIIYGCNERCTYCVVPTTRGVEQSRTIDAVVDEVSELVRLGYKEVTLLGQNIDSWGRDMNPKQKFADLLAAVAQVPEIKRVRFLTSHPKYMSQRVIQTVAKYPTLMPNFNVPFQSGDNTVLQMMRRGYTRERYLSIVKAIRALIPDAAIIADCIVGFPGETEEQFKATLDLMEEVKFDRIYTAAYSKRPNTPAALWDNQVDEETKQDRLQRINRLANQHALERSERYIGRIETVMVEDVDMKDPSMVIGHNPQNRLVHFQGSLQELKGKFVEVMITQAKPYSLYGEMVRVSGD